MEVCYLSSSTFIRIGNVRILIDIPIKLPSHIISYPSFEEETIRHIHEVHEDQRSHVDWELIDYIFISTVKGGLGLPLLHHTGFKGVIYATVPVKEFLKLQLEGYVFVQRLKRFKNSRSFEKDKLFTISDINRCIQAVNSIHFFQQIQCSDIIVQPYSTGYSVGSANWHIKFHDLHIWFLGKSSFADRHPLPLSFLPRNTKHPDFAILGHKVLSDAYLLESLKQIAKVISETITRNAFTFFPLDLDNCIVDLVLFLREMLEVSGRSHVPIYVVAPNCESFFSFLNISSEFLSPVFQSKVNFAEDPLPFKSYLENGLLFLYDSLEEVNEFQKPSIIMSSSACMEYGDSVHLMHSLKSDPLNSLIITDSDFEPDRILGKFYPFSIQVHNFSMNACFTKEDLLKFLLHLNPQEIFSPESCGIDKIKVLGSHHTRRINLEPEWIACKIQKELAESIRLKERVARCDSILQISDGTIVLKNTVQSNLEPISIDYVYKLLEKIGLPDFLTSQENSNLIKFSLKAVPVQIWWEKGVLKIISEKKSDLQLILDLIEKAAIETK